MLHRKDFMAFDYSVLAGSNSFDLPSVLVSVLV